MSLSTHVLDAARGLPAVGTSVRLERRDPDGGWTTLAEARTDDDGRIRHWNAEPGAGTHRLVFDTSALSDFYPEVTVVFTITDPGGHLHVPLLISPFAYSTYRGS
ncbi:5-hydroxyisourate hydrolase [Actinomadura pelletieri DSM 43383]|uniref:5-hydroxyisourate hydrolase n=1 Tax=Actinomadura pelletieri DSM 43383 TaxID=1120940 RepID=A0A495QHR4_9ACTN|nr:hydroxyisourate hydrolase [Actinomadura pelletieri]RKS71678.1 5-hydroxyisourate hydrolase [Actinomadura pelletieri DSM 43383]